MNRIRRKIIQQLITKVQELQEEMEIILEEIESVKDEETEYLENIPENLQSSERYEKAEMSAENLEAAYDAFEEKKDSLAKLLLFLKNLLNKKGKEKCIKSLTK